MNDQFFVYCHVRLDTNTVFYVGKGLKARINKKSSRNKYWRRIVAKYGFRAEILKSFDVESEAHAFEIQMITHYRNLGQAEANICDGGEGTTGLKFFHSEATKEKISRAGIGRPGFFKGKSLSESTKMKMSAIRRKGSDEEIKILTHPQRRTSKAQDYISPQGQVFTSSESAGKFAGVAGSTIRFWAKNLKFGWSARRKI